VKQPRKKFELFMLIVVMAWIAVFLSFGPDSRDQTPGLSDSETAGAHRPFAAYPEGTSESSTPEATASSQANLRGTSKREIHPAGASFDSALNTEKTRHDEHLAFEKRKAKRVFAGPISLDPLQISPNALTLNLSGFDPGGPRELVAWRNIGGRWAIVSEGYSDESGVIHFPEVMAPRDGIEIVVTDGFEAPEDLGASNSQRSALRLPQAPQGTLLHIGESEHFVRIVASETGGQILIAEPDGEVFGRYPIPMLPGPSNRVLEITLELKQPSDFVLIAHEFGDGRISEWKQIALSDAGMAPSPPVPLAGAN
jgi:hypothetical protein